MDAFGAEGIYMNIVFDSNIYIDDLKLSSIDLNLVMDYLEKTKSFIYMPTVILEEISAVYKRKLNTLLSKIDGNIRNYNSITTTPIVYSKPDYSKEGENLIIELKRKLNISDNHIISYKDEYFKESLSRAINQIKPSSEGREEVRDSIIWLTLLDLAKESSEKVIAFISNNTTDFAGNDKKSLHPRLQDDLKSNAVQIKFFTSIDEFVKEQIPKVEKYSKEYIQSKLDLVKIGADVERYFENNQGGIERITDRKGYGLLNYIQITNIDLKIESYNVYEMIDDNSFFLQVELYDEIEIETEVECLYNSSYYLGEYETGTKIKYFYIEIMAQYNIIIKDDKIIKEELEYVEL